MRTDQVAELKSNDVLRGRLAKYLARECFRNTKLEDLHAGQVPVSKTGDYSDVKVVTPDRDIAWNDISRISNSEMKELMIDAVNRCDRLLGAIFASDAIVDVLKEYDPVPNWNAPDWYDRIGVEEVDQLDELVKKLKGKVR